MSLSEIQRTTLLQPLNGNRVSKTQGNSYLEAFDVIAHLSRIFGFEGWDKEIIRLDLLFETENAQNKWTVAYRCAMRLTVRDPIGTTIKILEDVGVGDAINQPSRSNAHDLASKSAVSGALKRCAKDLGDQFGLGLYDGGSLAPCLKRVVIYDGLRAGEEPDAQDDGGTPTQDAANVVSTAFEDNTRMGSAVGGLLSQAQRARLFATAKSKKIAPHDAAKEALGCEITSINDLTVAEASKVIDWLTAQPTAS